MNRTLAERVRDAYYHDTTVSDALYGTMLAVAQEQDELDELNREYAQLCAERR